MLRKYINSQIHFVDVNTTSIIDGKLMIIQTERINDNLVLVEAVDREDLCDLISFGNLTTSNTKTINEADDDLVYEYRETIINNDPFGKYSGTKLGEIFDANDKGWVNNCIKNMKNTYIKDRVNYLAKYYKVV